MNDIRPHRKITKPRLPTPVELQHEAPVRVAQEPVIEQDTSLPPIETDMPEVSLKPAKKKRHMLKLLIALVLFAVAITSSYLWYQSQLEPVTSDQKASRVRLKIELGTTPDRIGKQLLDAKLIRNTLAFSIYTRLTNTQNKLQAGTYNLSPADSTATIVGHLTSGKVDEFRITFLPGATLAEDRKVLIKAGYSEKEIDTAFAKTYTHPLLADKPKTADLEGYIYGETYSFPTSATVDEILTRTFDEFYAAVQKEDLVNGFKKQDLSLYQGITLASIIQREVPSATDRKQVAQVFFTRLNSGMMLGSDVTYQYAADKLGVARDYTLDSPYNTRKYAGLPPGPIAAPGLTALQAVANPAPGDYVYFLSGDDDNTYFARTNAEHEQNIVTHCAKKCALQ